MVALSPAKRAAIAAPAPLAVVATVVTACGGQATAPSLSCCAPDPSAGQLAPLSYSFPLSGNTGSRHVVLGVFKPQNVTLPQVALDATLLTPRTPALLLRVASRLLGTFVGNVHGQPDFRLLAAPTTQGIDSGAAMQPASGVNNGCSRLPAAAGALTNTTFSVGATDLLCSSGHCSRLRYSCSETGGPRPRVTELRNSSALRHRWVCVGSKVRTLRLP